MAILSIISTQRRDVLAPLIEASFPEAHLEAEPGVWLVKTGKTTMEVAEVLGMNSDQSVRGIVLSIDSYFGFHNSDIWAWLKANWGN